MIIFKVLKKKINLTNRQTQNIKTDSTKHRKNVNGYFATFFIDTINHLRHVFERVINALYRAISNEMGAQFPLRDANMLNTSISS